MRNGTSTSRKSKPDDALPDAFTHEVAQPRRKRNRESDVEGRCVGWATRRRWYVRKFKSPGKRSAPDRLFAKGGMVVFIEFKRKGKKATPKQLEEHKQMRNVGGLTVHVFDNFNAFVAFMESIEEEW